MKAKFCVSMATGQLLKVVTITLFLTYKHNSTVIFKTLPQPVIKVKFCLSMATGQLLSCKHNIVLGL